jgi:hypothetical protein
MFTWARCCGCLRLALCLDLHRHSHDLVFFLSVLLPARSETGVAAPAALRSSPSQPPLPHLSFDSFHASFGGESRLQAPANTRCRDLIKPPSSRAPARCSAAGRLCLGPSFESEVVGVLFVAWRVVVVVRSSLQCESGGGDVMKRTVPGSGLRNFEAFNEAPHDGSVRSVPGCSSSVQ